MRQLLQQDKFFIVAFVFMLVMLTKELFGLYSDYKNEVSYKQHQEQEKQWATKVRQEETKLHEAMRNEPDPLMVESMSSELVTVNCGELLELPRYIRVSKALDVQVNRKFIKVDNGSHHTGEVFMLPNVTYSEKTPYSGYIVYSVKVPETFENGMYLYVPTLTYKVNEKLTITKAAPSQVFRVQRKCKY